MKCFLIPLLLSLLLCGCAAQNPQHEETQPALSAPAAQTNAADAEHLIHLSPTEKGFFLPKDVTGFLFLDENILLFSGNEDSTTLILNDPESGASIASHDVPFVLTTGNATVQLLNTGISYFDHSSMETVVLDRTLREIRRIPAPDDLVGMPLLDTAGRTLQYCTASAVRSLDLDTGISRILKEVSYPVQGLSGLLLEDSVLQLSITEADGTWRTLFLSSENGQLLAECEGNVLPETSGDTFFLHLLEGNLLTLLCGNVQGSPMVLHSRLDAEDCFFLGTQVLTTAWQDDVLCLDLYDLSTGLRSANLSVVPGQYPESAAADTAGNIWILWHQENGLTLEQVNMEPVQDHRVYTSPYYTRQNPDYDGLAACSLYAEELSEKYGVDIRVYKDASALEPWDYHLEYEYQAVVLHRELEALDSHLSHFPEGFLQTLAQKFTALNICIVRSAVGSPESGSLEAVNGIQFMDGFDAYIILATDHDTEYALFHELSHLMETVILTESVAYDRWDNLNPPDFRYDNDYISNQSRDGSAWLTDGRAYFIDTYSMSYPKEDRARLFEYAMTSGHDELFASPNLQQKLRQLCIGIREGFGLEKTPEIYLWEQYLQEPLTAKE